MLHCSCPPNHHVHSDLNLLLDWFNENILIVSKPYQQQISNFASSDNVRIYGITVWLMEVSLEAISQITLTCLASVA